MNVNNLNSVADLSIIEELSSLITETDPNSQAANVETILTKYVDISGFAISIIDEGSVIRQSNRKTIPENMLDELDRFFLGGQNALTTGNQYAITFRTNGHGSLSVPDGSAPWTTVTDANGLALLFEEHDLRGVMYLLTDPDTVSMAASDKAKTQFLSLLSNLVLNSYRHYQTSKKMRFYSLYETVSSALGYVGDLEELLTTIISIVVSELSSEEGSVLLLDEETNELEFFSAIGETGFGLKQLRFPAHKGVAGYALQNREALIINDVRSCPFFYKNIDDENDFKTTSILAVPLVSGDECIGVIEAINKLDGDGFDEQDKHILMAIADEVALAIKHARLFDYVVDSYCNIRRGNMSCKGCVRPLKSWTPCAKQLNKV